MGLKITYDANLEFGHKKVSLKTTNTDCTFLNSHLVRRAHMTLAFGMEIMFVINESVTQQTKKCLIEI